MKHEGENAFPTERGFCLLRSTFLCPRHGAVGGCGYVATAEKFNIIIAGIKVFPRQVQQYVSLARTGIYYTCKEGRLDWAPS